MSDQDLPLGLSRGTVRVVEYDLRWPELFRAEADRLAAAVAHAGLAPLVLEHMGSTAVPGLAAKPILDLMAGCPPGTNWQPHLELCVSLGYQPRGSRGVAGRELLVRGSETVRTHHLNLIEVGGTFWHVHLTFRDRLRADPALVAAYAALKCDLAARHASDREAYTNGKAAFVAAVLRGADAAAARVAVELGE
jgi:GrpB-like predicted nucleotidyltransferase (UPF0157 family)